MLLPSIRMVKFDRQALINALAGRTGYIELILIGKLNNGYYFMGEDTIKVILPSSSGGGKGQGGGQGKEK